jgi:N6-adenosine-specific RNA methylase IME4
VNYQLFPDLSQSEYEALKADIAENGVLVPVEYDEDGNILDGFHRVKACNELGIEDWPSITRVGFSEEEKRTHARRLNMNRRHLTRAQKRKQIRGQLLDTPEWSNNRIAILLSSTDKTVKTVRDEMIAGSEIPNLDKLFGADKKWYPANDPEPETEPEAQPEFCGLFARTEDKREKQAEAVKQLPQDLAEDVVKGDKTIPQAKREARQRNKPKTPPLPSGKYRCLVIDPPWPIEKIDREVRPNQGQFLDYPTMTIDEIKALDVPGKYDPNGCHVYLWVTHKYLPTGLILFDEWGIKYQCLMTWVKPTGMTPYSWMYDTEHVLFGRVGSLPLEKLGLKLSFEASITKHSEKPDIFFERVKLASPEKRLNMFARKERDGFESWGNEV